jgi:nucleotidyltransferase/DNA polymerase involved in DNA repair
VQKQSVILWVELMEFYVGHEGNDVPLVVHRGDLVLDANSIARKRGVHRGLLIKQARAILSEGKFIPWEEETYLRKQADWLDLCIAFSNVIEPADQHAAWIDLSAHPQAIDIADELFRTLQRATKLTISSGIASTKWLAQLAAKYDDCGPALRSPSAFLAGLPVQELLPVPIECRQRLQFLGYSKIGDVAGIPFQVLQDQFDEASFLIQNSASGGAYEPVDAAYPPASILEKFVFDGVADSLEAVHNTIDLLSQRIGRRLELQNLEGCLVSITLEFEDGKTKQISRTFSKPLRDAKTVLPSLHLLLEKNLNQPLSAIQILLSELKKVTVEQGAFLEKLGTRTPRRLEVAIKKAQAVFGDSSVKLGKEMKLPRRVYVLREWKNVTGWR